VHVTHELLMAVLDGRIPRNVIEKIVIEHLGALCPTCRQEIETFDWRSYRREVPHPSVYDVQFQRVAESVRDRRRAYEQELEQAQRWLAELRSVPPEDRRRTVERARTRFRGETFADLLVEESSQHLPDDPWSACSWADTAHAVHFHTPGLKKGGPIMVRVLAHRGNALRAMGRLNDAERDLHRARREVESHAVTDLAVCAELDCLEGSLRKDQRHLDLAEKLFHRATVVYRLLGEVELRARTEMKLGFVYYAHGEFAEAAWTTERALADLSLETTPRLYLYARFNLARALEALGEPGRSLALLEDDARYQDVHFDQLSQLRVIWLRGKVQLALRDRDGAEELLSAARDGFAAAGIGFDVAMVSLELALILLERGELGRVKQIAREAFQIFGSQNVHPEALGSLKIFRDAAVAESLSIEIVHQVVAHFREAGQKPAEETQPF